MKKIGFYMSICSSFCITIALTIIIYRIYLWRTYQIGYICDFMCMGSKYFRNV